MPAKNLNQVNLIGNMCSDILVKKIKAMNLESSHLRLIEATKAMITMNRISFNVPFGMNFCLKKHELI